ncbi:4-sulfomuconolactone hydrolase [Achromobacter veterisilvae]|uniref:4-sulfomuconolactone hydrolase n=1 Tax=Achromobacter veterisilvae TaxID=2069367 RepID=A0A446D146_9BURK|nr:amidohydrolase family protein [Achromobacter veterisilvae]SSW73775.1 4-sulfomuconolactone hydrolase [Achromobacter veterisilvae]
MPPPAHGAAVDTHAHVFRQGLALAQVRRHTPDHDATLAEYLALLDAHGLSHGVLVQPSFLGTDNSYLVQALRAARGRLRGVAVVAEDIAETALHDLAEAGVAGIRLNLIGLDLPSLQTPAWQTLLTRVNALGWHVELHVQAARLPDIVPALLAAGCRIVVDHFGRPAPALGTADPGFRYLLQQADSGRVWVKLSAPYRNWPASACAASGREAAQRLLAAYTPERLMWGSDWPHTEHRHLASYPAATQWRDAWIDDPVQRRALLADTPLRLFQFQGDES